MSHRKGDAAFDSWSLVHFASGAVLGLLVALWWLALLLLLAYEGVEGLLRRRRQGTGLFEHESWTNIGADLVVGMLGYAAVRLAVAA